MKRLSIATATIFIGALVMASTAAAGPEIKYGLWEITTTINMEGMPFAIPPMKIKNCIEKGNEVPEQKENNKDCKMVDSKVTGNTVKWKMECKDKRSTTVSTGKVTYSGDTFKGNTEVVITEGSKKSTMNQTMDGKRIGDCKK